jgi:hypothetical protein
MDGELPRSDALLLACLGDQALGQFGRRSHGGRPSSRRHSAEVSKFIFRLKEKTYENVGSKCSVYRRTRSWSDRLDGSNEERGALAHTPINAIPDLSDNQVIVFTDGAGRSHQEAEGQITYPLNRQSPEPTRRSRGANRVRLSASR